MGNSIMCMALSAVLGQDGEESQDNIVLVITSNDATTYWWGRKA